MERETPGIVSRAPQADRLDSPRDDRTFRSITERHEDAAESTGVEISSAVLGQDNKTGQVPFYTGIVATQHLLSLLYGYWWN